jgi:hypothetical protein
MCAHAYSWGCMSNCHTCWGIQLGEGDKVDRLRCLGKFVEMVGNAVAVVCGKERNNAGHAVESLMLQNPLVCERISGNFKNEAHNCLPDSSGF